MTTVEVPSTSIEPTLLGSAWRRKWLVVFFLLLGGGLAYGITVLLPSPYIATSTLVVQDPRATSLESEGDAQPSQRYLADQLVIMRSPAVAERAARVADEMAGSDRFTTSDFLVSADVLPATGSSSIFISFEAPDAESALIGADSLATAYQQLTAEGAQASASAALERIDAAIDAIDEDLASIEARISELRGSSTVDSLLEEQLTDAVERFAELEAERTSTTDPDELAAIRAELGDIAQQFSLLQTIRGLEASGPEVSALLQQQSDAITRRTDLSERRTEIEVNAELASSGIVLYSPAFLLGVSQGGLYRTVAVGLILGSLAGVGLAYGLELRRRAWTHPSEPEAVLGAPLLAAVPQLSHERLKSRLPALTDLQSASAEAFRFVASALEAHAVPAGFRTLAFISATGGAGKTLVIANSALASAQQGTGVLVVDADFGDQALTQLLTGDTSSNIGMTDVALGDIPLGEALIDIPTGSIGGLKLLSRGTQRVTAPEFFRSAEARVLFESIQADFGLVLIDTPPLLQVAYTGMIGSYADAVVVVLTHESPISELEAVVDRLSLIGASIAGYVYNRSPLRRSMTGTGGSLQDVLGLGEEDQRVGRRSRHKRDKSPG